MTELSPDELDGLLEKARRREPDALATLCEHFYPRVLKYMHYRVHGGQAQDLTSEVFLRVVRGIESQHGSFNAWLFRIASNVFADWLRRKKLTARVRTDEDAVRNHAGGENPAETVARRLDLADAIGQLTEEQQELVTLKFIQGLSNAEIAESTGRAPGAIRALQFRALSALRKILTAGGQQDDTAP